ncbi:hypothetical protein [Clostridium magnum]|uniref:Uncharacterized protein n=1 Tax=Clostridium magnum DSM 2767 TaxID=1121326 RepID=A0A168E1A7_9CLOT|nr:hypothetical protein [Clostridium magnum]KZL93545.1 hypothetical protein CLMAG_05910 [Clostridium magnum DSM 2767]SHI61228.1 hypothetical protein SAMN02745944_04585 [Clostridium magnum DSM 2767]
MKIIIQQIRLEEIYSSINDIYRTHSRKIKKVNRTKREIEFMNGDKIKFTTTESKNVDGLKSDVAIGPDAECITLASKHEKRIWGFSDLYNYLRNL